MAFPVPITKALRSAQLIRSLGMAKAYPAIVKKYGANVAYTIRKNYKSLEPYVDDSKGSPRKVSSAYRYMDDTGRLITEKAGKALIDRGSAPRTSRSSPTILTKETRYLPAPSRVTALKSQVKKTPVKSSAKTASESKKPAKKADKSWWGSLTAKQKIAARKQEAKDDQEMNFRKGGPVKKTYTSSHNKAKK